jgi:hypothetical protein
MLIRMKGIQKSLNDLISIAFSLAMVSDTIKRQKGNVFLARTISKFWLLSDLVPISCIQILLRILHCQIAE